MVFVSGAVRPGEQEQAMKATITESYYLRCDASNVPDGLRFNVPGRFQGQIVEYAFADAITRRGEAGVGSAWKMTTDWSNRSVRYGQRHVEIETARGVRTYADGSRCRRFRVALGTGAVEAWDVVADHWTICHSLTARQIAALRSAARDAA
jgi:hypothetical protein